jgi:hypothetical protein
MPASFLLKYQEPVFASDVVALGTEIVTNTQRDQRVYSDCVARLNTQTATGTRERELDDAGLCYSSIPRREFR